MYGDSLAIAQLAGMTFIPENTSFVCDNCLLPYSRHNFGGGSMVRSAQGSYICDRYSQKKQIRKEQANAASNQ